jgi:VWFA-related protein
MRRTSYLLRRFLPADLLLATVLVWVLACIPAATASAQAPAGPLEARPGAKPESAPPPPADAKNTIRVRVNEVTAPVSVVDERGEPVLNLEKKDFHIFDNDLERPIEHWDLGGDPLSIVLVAETSSHIEALMPAIHQASIVFTQTVMALSGDAAVIGYDDTVDLLQSFTSDQDTIERTIRGLRIGTSGMRLYDAMARAVTLLEKQPENRRRVMLVMGEAHDSGSENKLGEVLRNAQLANISIYTIGLSSTAADLKTPKQYKPNEIGPPGTYPVPLPPGTPVTPDNEDRMYGNMDLLSLAIWIVERASNEVKAHALEVASAATGGTYERTFKDRSIQKVMDQIGGQLHAQYSLTYKPVGDEPSGFHRISVTVSRPGVKVRTRPGYYLAPG